MPSQLVKLNCHIKASPEEVFDFFCDHESFGRIWPGRTRRIKESSDPANPNGVGSIRQICLGPMCFEETQITCDRPALIEYTVTRGSPIKNHLGRICLTAATDGGTDIDYRISFDPRIPLTGALIANSLTKDWSKGIVPIIQELESAG